MNARFTVRLSRSACFYFFVQNLSCWNVYSRKNYNQAWERKLGAFSADEKSALYAFKEVRKRYPQEDSPFERAFFHSDKPMAVLEKLIPKPEHATVKHAFEVLAPKFDLVFIEDSSNLDKWRGTLEKALSDDRSAPLLSTLASLYSMPADWKGDFEIFILPAGDMTAGMTEIDDHSMGLEISKLSIENMLPQIVSVIFFELAHLAFKDKFVLPLAMQLCDGDDKRARFVTETVGRLFLPAGILSLRFLGIPVPPQMSQFLGPKETKKLFDLADPYVKDGKPIDNALVSAVMEATKLHAPWMQ